jgi:hypothetical protein
MPTIRYQRWSPRADTLAVVARARQICQAYADAGYGLSLRQLYYALVKELAIPNTDESYARLKSIITRARRAGLIDWTHIEDRTRVLRQFETWADPSAAVNELAGYYHEDLWRDQDYYLECWVEKDALEEVVRRAAQTWSVPSFACKGYASESSMWRAAMRLADAQRRGKRPVVLYAGDHDPSGLDMGRDIEDRLYLLMQAWAALPSLQVERIALTIEQVEERDLPPNPAKQTDSRWREYVLSTGLDLSWELDALEPAELAGLFDAAIRRYVVLDRFERNTAAMEENRDTLVRFARAYDEGELDL